MANYTTCNKEAPIRNPDIILHKTESEEAWLFNPDTNQIRAINATGLFIWKQCDGNRDLPTIIQALKASFDKIPEVEVDIQVMEFVNEMKNHGFLGHIIKNI